MSDTVTRVPSPDEWVTAVRAAFQDGFTFFDWLSAVDVTDDADAPEFDVVCHLLDVSTPGQLRECRLAVRIADGVALPSLTAIYPGAAWHERETHEMFGIAVSGFVDGTGLGLRPLLLPDAFEGTPLRKSFQLAARASKTWPGGKEPGEGHDSAKSPSRRRVQAPGVPPPEWGPRQ
ncbi:MAG: NADH-quinone oxidoreductase subunit C [Phycicoccus sp.]|nr:NADH-quinone oxidoreductase subunit C [Phycicoccus sp.]